MEYEPEYKKIQNRNMERLIKWIPIDRNESVTMFVPSELIDLDLDLSNNTTTVCIDENLSDIIKNNSLNLAHQNWMIILEAAAFSMKELQLFLNWVGLNAPDHLIIVAENRLKLSKMSGTEITPDQYTGHLIRKNNDEKAKYTKSELISLLSEWHIDKIYYPAPDWCYITDIYSDNYYPAVRGYQGKPFDFFSDRVEFNDIIELREAVISENMYDRFSEGFVIIAENKECDKEPIVIPDYIHYSCKRDDRFNVCTELYNIKGAKPYALKKKSRVNLKHVNSIIAKYDKLSGAYRQDDLKWNKITKTESEQICLEYIEGTTLEEELDALLNSGEVEHLKKKIKDYFNRFTENQKMFPYIETEGFDEVFGTQDVNALNGMTCLSNTDIDCTFGNAILNDNVYTIMDYEWTFDFPIPWKFVEWRCIYYYMHYLEFRERNLGNLLFDEFSITETQQKIFLEMEMKFQDYVQGQNNNWEIARRLKKNNYEITEFIEDNNRMKSVVDSWNEFMFNSFVKIYYDYGSGFNEDQTEVIIPKYGDDGIGEIKIDVRAGIKQLRIDPSQNIGILHIHKIENQHGKTKKPKFFNLKHLGKSTNAFKSSVWIAENNDPYFVINVSQNDRMINVLFTYDLLINQRSDLSPEELLSKNYCQQDIIKRLDKR